MGAHNQAVYRLGGNSALTIAALYLVITSLYVVVGVAPSGAMSWLAYLGPDASIWWAIVILSAITDFLFLAVALAIYRALRGVSETALLVGSGLIAAFAIIDLAVTQMNFATLIDLSVQYATAAEVQRSALVAAATYSSAVIDSFMLGVYVLLVPGLGILVVSVVMLKAGFGRITAWLGIAAGLAGALAVIGPPFAPALDSAAIVAALLTTAWVVPVGRKLLKLANDRSVGVSRAPFEAAYPVGAQSRRTPFG